MGCFFLIYLHGSGDGEGWRRLSEDEHAAPLYQKIIGIVLMIIGAVFTNLGNNLMSLGHSQQREIDQVMADYEKRMTLKRSNSMSPPGSAGTRTRAKKEMKKNDTQISDLENAKMDTLEDLVQIKTKPKPLNLENLGNWNTGITYLLCVMASCSLNKSQPALLCRTRRLGFIFLIFIVLIVRLL